MTSWKWVKKLITDNSLIPSYVESDSMYTVRIYANGVLLEECNIIKALNLEDALDFETNYKATATLGGGFQVDTDNAQIVRVKAAKKGWSFWAVPVEITTSTLLGSLFAQTSDGTDIPWVNCKIYNGSNEEITTAGLANINLSTCVKTVIDFEPTFDFEIIGGALRINSNPAQDIRLWIVGAPDIPAIYGGSKEFASGINLKFLAPDSSFEIDGRVTKYLTYNASTHTGKMRIILKHPAGVQVNMQLVIHLYRQ